MSVCLKSAYFSSNILEQSVKFGEQLIQDEECEEYQGETTDTESGDADYRLDICDML